MFHTVKCVFLPENVYQNAFGNRDPPGPAGIACRRDSEG